MHAMGINLNDTFKYLGTERWFNGGHGPRGNVGARCIRYYCSELSIYSSRCSVS